MSEIRWEEIQLFIGGRDANKMWGLGCHWAMILIYHLTGRRAEEGSQVQEIWVVINNELIEF